jgi:hypothetical protein
MNHKEFAQKMNSCTVLYVEDDADDNIKILNNKEKT